MISSLGVVRKYAGEIRIGGDFETAVGYLSDYFQNFDRDGNVALTKEGILAMGRMMNASFTDYGFVLKDLCDEGDFVIMTGHFEGKFTSDLDLSPLGVGIIPATGKKIVWPEASAKIMVEGEKIVRMEPYAGAAGLKAFLSVLGVEPPER